MAEMGHKMIYRHLQCDYGLIDDRLADYSADPVPVFAFLNNWAPLKAIAVVTYREQSKALANIDQSLSSKPLSIHDTLDAAQAWMVREMKRTLSGAQ